MKVRCPNIVIVDQTSWPVSESMQTESGSKHPHLVLRGSLVLGNRSLIRKKSNVGVGYQLKLQGSNDRTINIFIRIDVRMLIGFIIHI